MPQQEFRAEWACPYTEAVYCKTKEKRCGNCGWNPVVTVDRFKKFCEGHNITVNLELLSINKEDLQWKKDACVVEQL